MITITNIKPEIPPKKSLYRVCINEQIICEFEHNRSDGLYQCMIKAANEAEKARWVNAYDAIKDLEG